MPGEPDTDCGSDDLLDDNNEACTPDNAVLVNADGGHGFVVGEADQGRRLDAFLPGLIDGLSRNRIQDLIRAGDVLINDTVIKTPNHRLKAADRVAIIVPPPEDPTPLGEEIALSVVFEDDDLIIIDKPADMVVHPAAGNWTGTLVNALIHHCGDSLSGVGGVRRPGIVHRLDKETSGLLVVAKNDFTHRGLAAQFADHGRTGPLRRAYQAIVWNAPTRAAGTIEARIGRSTTNRLKMAVLDDRGRGDAGREAITHYDLVEQYGTALNGGVALASLVNCHLETGRTHQIRVHMAHIGCPLLGDQVYGSGYATKAARLPEPLEGMVRGLKRQALHAFLLEIEHPRTGETLSFESPLPEDLAALVAAFESFA